MWFKKCEREKKSHFWELMKLVKNNNSVDFLNMKLPEIDEDDLTFDIDETENDENTNVSDIEEENYEEVSYESTKSCLVCNKDIDKNIFLDHVDECDDFDADENTFSCINCDQEFESKDTLCKHMLDC